MKIPWRFTTATSALLFAIDFTSDHDQEFAFADWCSTCHPSNLHLHPSPHNWRTICSLRHCRLPVSTRISQSNFNIPLGWFKIIFDELRNSDDIGKLSRLKFLWRHVIIIRRRINQTKIFYNFVIKNLPFVLRTSSDLCKSFELLKNFTCSFFSNQIYRVWRGRKFILNFFRLRLGCFSITTDQKAFTCQIGVTVFKKKRAYIYLPVGAFPLFGSFLASLTHRWALTSWQHPEAHSLSALSTALHL